MRKESFWLGLLVAAVAAVYVGHYSAAAPAAAADPPPCSCAPAPDAATARAPR